MRKVAYTYMHVATYTCVHTISLCALVPNSRDRQGKLWLLKKQKTARKTTLKIQIQAINLYLPSY